MNSSNHPDERTTNNGPIGDQNVERLLTNAYQPEQLDPEFVRRVSARAQAEAKLGRGTDGPSSAARTRSIWRGQSWRWVAVAAAAILLAVASYQWALRQPTPEAFYRDGELVWIDGRPYAVSDSDAAAATRRPVFRPVADAERDGSGAALRVGREGLTPRRHVGPTPLQPVAFGESIVTGHGVRRRISLPDGSQLYVNENASLKIEGDRRIAVQRGEVFVEVSPADAANGKPTFVVQTPHRDVAALGTRFAVRVDEQTMGVAVTQGKVKVTGLDSMVIAGQQIHLDASDGEEKPPQVSSLPRASHVLYWTRDLMAAAESPLVPGSQYEGGALMAVDPNGQQTKLSLRKYHIDVFIQDGFARTTIDQTYFNHLAGRLEGTFYFPLPADASISRLAMYVNGRLMEGGMAERERARDVFETIKFRALDPALLEWVDGSTFKMRVFPLEGRQEKRIVLSYTQRLDSNYGRTDFRFPAGHSMDLVREWSLHVHVEDGAELEWECASHDLEADTSAGDLVLTGTAANTKPDRDVVIQFTDSRIAEEPVVERTRFASVEHDGWRYLMLRWRPEWPARERRLRRDWVFLVDADGSRDPVVARVQADIVRTLLEHAEHDDTFSIITCGTRIRAFAPEQKPVSAANISSASEFLDATHLIGALDLEQAFGAANAYIRAVDNPVLVHVGSGVPILGQRETDKLLGNLSKKAPYIGVAVGKRWNRSLMKAAAGKTGGCFTRINPDEPIKWRTVELLSTINAARLLDVHVTANAEKIKFLVVKDALEHGEELCAVARLERTAPEITHVNVAGMIEGRPLRRSIPVANSADGADYLPRIWARLAIDEMVAGGAQANRSAIVELSKSMYVMSPFTSLLVLENDEMYKQYNVDRGRKDHWALYPCPEEIDVVREPTEGGHRTDVSDPAKQPPSKPSPADVLRSLLIHRPAAATRTLETLLRLGELSVPDGGTLLLGGIAPIRQGIPTLHSVPPVNRLFRNQGLGRRAEALQMIVTPRVIIQEEEELLETSALDGRRFWDVTGNGPDRDFDGLYDDWIELTVTPEPWGEIGGPAALNPFPANLSLIVDQSQRFEERFDGEFIRDLTPRNFIVPHFQPEARTDWTIQIYDTPSDFGAFGISLSDEAQIALPDPQIWMDLTRRPSHYKLADLTRSVTSAEKRIQQQLDRKVDFTYQNQSLAVVVKDIHKRFNIPIVIRTESLEEQGIAADSLVSLAVKGVSLRAALGLILRDLELTHIVADDMLRITTCEDAENYLARRPYWIDETLMLIRRGDTARARGRQQKSDRKTWWSVPGRHRFRLVDRRARILAQRASQNLPQPDFRYPDLNAEGSRRMFGRLVGFAPGFNTTSDDILAILETEADWKNRPKTGTIDNRAQNLINAARSRGWQLVTFGGHDGLVALHLKIDGRGRFRCERKTEHGLREIVVCDGPRLLHLYPELGLAASRSMSRFHRAGLNRLVPWLLPPVAELAVGADVRLIGPRTVAIAPHKLEKAKDENEKPLPYWRHHLVFAPDGRLSERQLVEMPAGEIKARITFAENGTVTWLDDQGERLDRLTIAVEESSEPDVDPDLDQLVVLPMPVRDRGHIREIAKKNAAKKYSSTKGGNALQQIAIDQQERQVNDPAYWSEEDALRLIVASFRQDPAEMRNVIGRRFLTRGDRRLGFYTLLYSGGERWEIHEPVELSDGTTTRMDPLADHPQSQLARYIAERLDDTLTPLNKARRGNGPDQNRFIDQLSTFQRLLAKWSVAGRLPTDAEARRVAVDQVFQFVSRCDSPRFAYALLRRVQRKLGSSQPHGRIAETLIALEKKGIVSYVVKYELARSLAAGGRKKQAQRLFLQLYQETLEAGILPPIDQTFCELIKESEESPFSSDGRSEKGLRGLMRGACAHLIESHQRPSAIALAWQCRQLGEKALADILINQALTGIPDGEQPATMLSAVDYLLRVKNYDRAGTLVHALLANERFAPSPSLWRLASQIAEHGGRVAHSVSCLEKAMDLEYKSLPARYNVEQVRSTYRGLFEAYQRLARLVTVPGIDAPMDLAQRAVRAADRWRSLETDVTDACRQAADLLNVVGQTDLAWDYLTTPLAMKPNESTAWLELAKSLRDDGKLELAGRAYQRAFEAESTNAQILWDHAQLLEQAGRAEDAGRIYAQIAEGDWQPRFSGIKRKAERIVAALK